MSKTTGTRRGFVAALACLLLAAILPGRPAAALTLVWDPAAQFSIVGGNPNGAWSYGWQDDFAAAFVAYDRSDSSGTGRVPIWYYNVPNSPPRGSIWFNTTDHPIEGVPVGQVALHPGSNGGPAVLRWTALPGAGGELRVTGGFGAGNWGVMAVAVKHNGEPLWQAVDQGVFDLALPVAPGDSVDFLVHQGFAAGATSLVAELALELDPAWLPRLAIEAQGADLLLSFPALHGVTYRIERAISPAGPWTAFATLTAGQDGPLELIDAGAAAGDARACYRLRLLLP